MAPRPLRPGFRSDIRPRSPRWLRWARLDTGRRWEDGPPGRRARTRRPSLRSTSPRPRRPGPTAGTASPPLVPSVRLSQVPPGHLRWALESEHREHRWPDVTQRTARPQPARWRAGDEKRYRVCRVRGVGATRRGIDHELAIAVVGR